MKVIALPLLALLLSACASMQPGTADMISRLPVVKVGETPPVKGDYVVHIPAGYEFPVTLTTGGNLFDEQRQLHARTRLSRDLYLYKFWASYDGKHWLSSHALLDVQFSGGFDVHGLQTQIQLDSQ